MKLKIDHEQLEKYRKIYQLIIMQLQTDKLVADGSKLLQEDAEIAAMVCLFAKLYKLVEE